jgi:hypothetical protein
MSSGKKTISLLNIEREFYETYLNGLSIFLAPELSIPKLLQGLNYIRS